MVVGCNSLKPLILLGSSHNQPTTKNKTHIEPIDIYKNNWL